MKTFDDLVFNTHPIGNGSYATMNFANGYGVSVIFGDKFYSNGIDTYEVAILLDDDICYTTDITSDVIGFIKQDKVTKIMKQVQELETAIEQKD